MRGRRLGSGLIPPEFRRVGRVDSRYPYPRLIALIHYLKNLPEPHPTSPRAAVYRAFYRQLFEQFKDIL